MDSIDDLLSWNDKQGRILTGDGILMQRTVEGKHYHTSDLPHHYLSLGNTVYMTKQWLSQSKQRYSIIGCWNRPLFSGGWLESTSNDTIAYNLQTPSLFIDMRFPMQFPEHWYKNFPCICTCVSSSDDLAIRMLARQHCFAGYSLPEDPNVVASSEAVPTSSTLFTRHHFIDWNYHPGYPRSRPNRWWVDTKADKSSFKEFSFARDSFGVPVYFERWQRYSNDGHGNSYFAMRKRIPSSAPIQRNQEKCSCQDYQSRESIVIIVGNFFAQAIDRDVKNLPNYDDASSGGCAGLVDHAVQSGRRSDAIAMIDMIGLVGRIRNDEDNDCWKIDKCTHPWLIGTSFLLPTSRIDIVCDSLGKVLEVVWDGVAWDVVECSHSVREIEDMFRLSNAHVTRTLRSEDRSTVAKISDSKL